MGLGKKNVIDFAITLGFVMGFLEIPSHFGRTGQPEIVMGFKGFPKKIDRQFSLASKIVMGFLEFPSQFCLPNRFGRQNPSHFWLPN